MKIDRKKSDTGSNEILWDIFVFGSRVEGTKLWLSYYKHPRITFQLHFGTYNSFCYNIFFFFNFSIYTLIRAELIQIYTLQFIFKVAFLITYLHIQNLKSKFMIKNRRISIILFELVLHLSFDSSSWRCNFI